MTIKPDGRGIWVGQERPKPDMCFRCHRPSWSGPVCYDCRVAEEEAEERRVLDIHWNNVEDPEVKKALGNLLRRDEYPPTSEIAEVRQTSFPFVVGGG